MARVSPDAEMKIELPPSLEIALIHVLPELQAPPTPREWIQQLRTLRDIEADVSSIFASRFSGGRASCMLRTDPATASKLFRLSGRHALFSSPSSRNTQVQDWGIVWINCSNYDHTFEEVCKDDGFHGLIPSSNPESVGIRYCKNSLAAARLRHDPSTRFSADNRHVVGKHYFHLTGLPPNSEYSTVLDVLKHMKWAAFPGRKLTKGNHCLWQVRADCSPPQDIIHTSSGPILIEALNGSPLVTQTLPQATYVSVSTPAPEQEPSADLIRKLVAQQIHVEVQQQQQLHKEDLHRTNENSSNDMKQLVQEIHEIQKQMVFLTENQGQHLKAVHAVTQWQEQQQKATTLLQQELKKLATEQHTQNNNNQKNFDDFKTLFGDISQMIKTTNSSVQATQRQIESAAQSISFLSAENESIRTVLNQPDISAGSSPLRKNAARDGASSSTAGTASKMETS